MLKLWIQQKWKIDCKSIEESSGDEQFNWHFGYAGEQLMQIKPLMMWYNGSSKTSVCLNLEEKVIVWYY